MGEIDLNTYKAEKAACDELLLKTKNAYAAVLAQAKQKQDEQARQDSRKEASKAIFDADTLTTALAELLIDRVLVYPDKRMEIAYKIQDIFELRWQTWKLRSIAEWADWASVLSSPMKLTSSASFSPSIRISLRLRIHQAQAKNFCRVLDIRVAKVMEADTLAVGPLQYGGQPLADSSGISGRVIVQRGGEHPCRVYFGFVVAQYHQNRGREDDAPVGRLCFRLGHCQFSLDPVYLPLYLKFSGVEV